MGATEAEDARQRRRWERQLLALEAVLGGGSLALVVGSVLDVGPSGVVTGTASVLVAVTALTVAWHWTMEGLGKTEPLEAGAGDGSYLGALRALQRFLLLGLFGSVVPLFLSISDTGDQITGPDPTLGWLWLFGWVVFVCAVTLRATLGFRGHRETPRTDDRGTKL